MARDTEQMPWLKTLTNENLINDIRNAFREEISATPLRTKGWDDLSEEQQEKAKARFATASEAMVRKSLEFLNSRGEEHLEGEVKKAGMTDKKITLTVEVDVGPRAAELVTRLVGKQVTLIDSDVRQNAGDAHPFRVVPDQPSLMPEDGDDAVAGADPGSVEPAEGVLPGEEGQPDWNHINATLNTPLEPDEGGEGSGFDDDLPATDDDTVTLESLKGIAGANESSHLFPAATAEENAGGGEDAGGLFGDDDRVPVTDEAAAAYAEPIGGDDAEAALGEVEAVDTPPASMAIPATGARGRRKSS